MEIKEEILDQMVDYMEKMKVMDADNLSIQIGEYKGYKVRVELRKPKKTDNKQ